MAELGKSQPGLPHVVSCVHIRAVCDKKLDNRVCTLEHSRVHSGLAQGILRIDVDTQLHTEFDGFEGVGLRQDRKSTRLNSSHGSISYAVFCLKKKNKVERQGQRMQ